MKLEVLLGSACILLVRLQFATGISMKNASIPHYGVKDGTVELTCDFDLESDKLLNVKWYKDEAEFFSYAGNSIQVFPLDGIQVDIVKSSQKIVTLKNISLNTSGLFRCEVLADRSFQRLTYQGQMIVVAPPAANPEIMVKGHISRTPISVSLGERIIGNCTSRRSKPAASLLFYINGQKADYADITEYTPVHESGGLETSILGFNFILDDQRVRDSKLELKCTASLGNHYRVSIIELRESRVIAQPSSNLQFSNSEAGFLSKHPAFSVFIFTFTGMRNW